MTRQNWSSMHSHASTPSPISDPTSAVYTRNAEGVLVFSTTMNNTLASLKHKKLYSIN